MPDVEEDVTATFRKLVIDELAENARKNSKAERKRTSAGWLIQSSGELARKIGMNRRLMQRTLGQVGDPVGVVNRSKFLGRIRRALGIDERVSRMLPASRADILESFGELPPDLFAEMVDEYRKRTPK